MSRGPMAAWIAAAVLGAWSGVRAEVTIPPFPEGETPFPDYRVTVNGREAGVYAARTLDAPFAGKSWDHGGPYGFVSFDFGGVATVKVSSTRSLAGAMIQPASRGVRPEARGDRELTFMLDAPAKLSLEPDGKRGPLLIFANAPETNPPRSNDAGVVWFGPGVHKPGRIALKSGQTLYLAGGAVVKGSVSARGTNIAIRGRGMLCGNDWAWTKGPGHMLSIEGTNVTVEGIVLRGSWSWTLVPRGSREVTIRNVKICNGRVQNDDGINPCNSSKVLIEDCFIRTDDDCIALKGISAAAGNVEDIAVRNCILWCDRARVTLLGHESRAPFMRRILYENIDVPHWSMTAFLLEPGEEMRLEAVAVRHVRLHGGGPSLARVKPVVNQYMRTQVPGHARAIAFEDVAVTGAGAARCLVEVVGADAEHRAADVRLRGVTVDGVKVGADSPRLKIGPMTDGVTAE